MPARDVTLERSWRKRMRQYEQSGLTIKEFCDREKLIAHQFSWWRSELKRRDGRTQAVSARPKKRVRPAKARTETTFVPVRIESATAPSVEVVLDQPPRIRVSAGFDAELLREVVRVLESR